jgi:branched-chain amino acid transport system substrate-binding protein
LVNYDREETMPSKKRSVMIAVLVIGSTLLAACAAPTPEQVEVTREVTKIVEGTPEQVVEVVTATPEPEKEELVELPESIVVGCLEPLTGAHGVFGTEAKIGMEMAIEHINDAGGIESLGGIPLELVVEDCGESADSAKLGAESIVSKHRPVAILGTYISRLTMAATEVTEREGVIIIADALLDDLTSTGRRYLFRPCPKAGQHGRSSVQFVVDMAEKAGTPVEKVAILNEDSAFGRGVSTGAMQSALDNGLTVVYQAEYPYDISDASTIVADVAQAEPDFIAHCPYFMDGIIFANAFREANALPKFIAGMGACGFADPESIEAMGDTANYYSNTYSYNPFKDTPQNNKFVEAFEAEVGHIPTEAAGMNYYAMWVLKEALEASGEKFPEDPLNVDNLRQAFLSLDLTSGPAVETYPGDHVFFNEQGDNPDAKAVVLQVIDGEPKAVWPVEDAEVEAVFPRPDATY